jgi:hypothetical protein
MQAEQATGGSIWLVCGVQAAGKSALADLLARRFERGVHIRGAQFYRWAVSGWVHPVEAGDQEARRLLDLRYRLAARTADEYCRAGFSTVVQDNIFGPDIVRWLQSVRARPRHLVVLRPSLAVIRRREDERRRATGKVAYRPGEVTPEGLDEQLAATPRIGLWLDNSNLTAAQTADEVFRRRAEAIVELPDPAAGDGAGERI